MKYRVTHTTRYDYSEPVPICYNQARLTPCTCAYQELIETHLDVTPVRPVLGRRRRDYFGNEVTYFTVQEPHQTLSIVVTSEVRLLPTALPEPANTMPWSDIAPCLRGLRDTEPMEAYQFLFDSLLVRALPELESYARPSFPNDRPALEGILELTGRIYADFTYDPTATTIATPLEDVVGRRRGVCQDFAHLEIACLRAVGVPARYVSGYIFGGDRAEPQRLTGAWASHAWVSAYVPEWGWVDVDPTNNMPASLEHITLAWGRDYEDVSPIRGVVLGGGDHSLSVAVEIARLD